MRPMDSAFKRQMAPPLSLLVLGALTPEEHRVTVTDENVERLNLDDRPDLVGITVKVDTAIRSWEIARFYREKGIPVVFGGIYPTTCPDDNIDYADCIVIGEAEALWGKLLRDIQMHRLQKIYRNERPPDLSLSPIPKWELIAAKNYLYTNTLTVGRGCRWRCAFCYNSSPNLPDGYRMKPFDNILKEIDSLKTKHVMFIDDNFIACPSLTRKLLKVFQPLGLTWHTAVSADIGRHDDILDMMALSGCRSLFIGFETLNKTSLRKAGKRQNRIEDYERTIAKIHGRGMMVNASVVFGFDEDGPEAFKSTTDWLIEQKIATMTAHIMTPYPGTKLYSKLAAEKRIIDTNLNHYNTSRAVFQPAGMSSDELEAGYLDAYRRFYSWRGILRRMPEDKKRLASFLMFNVFYRKYGKIFAALGAAGLMRFLGKLGAGLSYSSLRKR